MLINGLIEIKNYLPSITLKGDQALFDDTIDIVENELTSDILGHAIYARLAEDNDDDAILLNLVKRYIAIRAFVIVVPDLNVVLTEAGFAVENSDRLAPASKQRIDDLIYSLQSRADMTLNAIIELLVSSPSYDDEWRSTSQYERISAGLIYSYSDFCKNAVLTPEVRDNYPDGYGRFATLYPAMAMIVKTKIAKYIGDVFIILLIEKIRDREALSSEENYVIGPIKSAVASYVLGDCAKADEIMMGIVAYMKENITFFPSFASMIADTVNIDHSDTPIFSML